MIKIPEKFRPIIIGVVLAGIFQLVVFAADLATDAPDCCATGFDATPYEQIPAGQP